VPRNLSRTTLIIIFKRIHKSARLQLTLLETHSSAAAATAVCHRRQDQESHAPSECIMSMSARYTVMAKRVSLSHCVRSSVGRKTAAAATSGAQQRAARLAARDSRAAHTSERKFPRSLAHVSRRRCSHLRIIPSLTPCSHRGVAAWGWAWPRDALL
jgi:hypothetical protein